MRKIGSGVIKQKVKRVAKNSNDKEFVNAERIHEYLKRCGKVVPMEEITDMLQEIECFTNKEHIVFEQFYDFMTSFISKEQDQYHNTFTEFQTLQTENILNSEENELKEEK